MRLLKVFAEVLMTALLAALVLAALVVLKPGWFLNTATLSWALRRYVPELRWETLDLQVLSPGIREKTLRLKAGGFCYRSPTAEGCARSVELRLGVRFSLAGLERLDVAKLHVEGESLRIDRARRPPERREGPPSLPAAPRLASWAGKVDLGDVRMILPSLIVTGPPRLRAEAALTREPGEDRPLRLHLAGSRGEAPFRLDAALESLRGVGGRLAVEGSLAGRMAGKSLTARLRGERGPDRLAARVSWGFRDPRGLLRSLASEDCSLSAPLAGDGRVLQASLDCRYRASPGPLGNRTPPRLEGRLKGRADFPEGGEAFDVRLLFTSDPYEDWYKLSAEAELRAAGRFDRLEELEVWHKLDASLNVARFSELVAFLAGTPYAVPAPLHVLEGPLSLRARSEGRPGEEPRRLDLTLRSQLASRRQRLALKADGALHARGLAGPERSFRVEADVALEDVVLELPYLELQRPPKATLDPRIARLPREDLRDVPGRAPLAVELKARVRTAGRPVRLLSNLAEEPIPVTLDLELRRPPPTTSGTVTVRKFSLELFQRKAVLDHFRVRLRPGAKAGDIEGLLLHRTGGVVVRIMLLGSTAKPRVELESDPPMDRQAILALLLYGKPTQALESEEASTVGNLNSALTTQAFGLMSLFLFGSTPVEYIGYDPMTQSYVVRLRIPGGATMELGTDLDESRSLRLRKRLAPRWFLETEVRREEERSLATTFLEWFNRY